MDRDGHNGGVWKGQSRLKIYVVKNQIWHL